MVIKTCSMTNMVGAASAAQQLLAAAMLDVPVGCRIRGTWEDYSGELLFTTVYPAPVVEIGRKWVTVETSQGRLQVRPSFLSTGDYTPRIEFYINEV